MSGGAFDATMLILLFNEKAAAPLDASTGKPVEGAQARIRHLITRITNSRGRIIVPAPAMGELLVKTAPETAVEYLALLGRAKGFRIAPFGERAAIEFAEMQRQLLTADERRVAGETRAKAKFDQQIVAIARVEGATTVFSDDDGLRRYAERFGLTVEGVADLRMPPARDLQQELPLDPPEAEPEKSAEPA